MKKLVTLLKKTGVGFIDGNYKSYYGFNLIRNSPKLIMSINFSVNNKYVGEYNLLVLKIVGKQKVFGFLCDKSGGTVLLRKKNKTNITITLSPFEENTSSGTFIAECDWGKPSKRGK